MPERRGQSFATQQRGAKQRAGAGLDHQRSDIAAAVARQQDALAGTGGSRADQHAEILRIGDAIDGQQCAPFEGAQRQNVGELPVTWPAQIRRDPLILARIARDTRQFRTPVQEDFGPLLARECLDLFDYRCRLVAAGEMEPLAHDTGRLQGLEYRIAPVDRKAAIESGLALQVGLARNNAHLAWQYLQASRRSACLFAI